MDNTIVAGSVDEYANGLEAELTALRLRVRELDADLVSEKDINSRLHNVIDVQETRYQAVVKAARNVCDSNDPILGKGIFELQDRLDELDALSSVKKDGEG